mmetsp:Transcript_23471/g.59943  ORF Transcript_23471/g.59943 Transcript_23471/m.59943 type:complete len:248 (-) Transcript_23471:1032-1775(-)
MQSSPQLSMFSSSSGSKAATPETSRNSVSFALPSRMTSAASRAFTRRKPEVPMGKPSSEAAPPSAERANHISPLASTSSPSPTSWPSPPKLMQRRGLPSVWNCTRLAVGRLSTAVTTAPLGSSCSVTIRALCMNWSDKRKRSATRPERSTVPMGTGLLFDGFAWPAACRAAASTMRAAISRIEAASAAETPDSSASSSISAGANAEASRLMLSPSRLSVAVAASSSSCSSSANSASMRESSCSRAAT